MADGPFAAVLAARRGVVVPPGATPAFLAPFPVGVLEDGSVGGAALTDVLVRLGITTLAGLAALPRADLLARFGWPGERAHRLASGDDARLPDTRPPPPDLVATVELDPPAERVDAAAFAAKRLADDLHERLAGRGLSCAQVLVTAETEHGEVHQRCWRHEGALTASAMAERVRWQLEGWLGSRAASRPTAGIALLRLEPTEVGAARGRQLGFWGGETAAAERAARALARVDGLLGAGAATVPERRGGRSPAEAVGLVPADAVDLTERSLARTEVGRPLARPAAHPVTGPGPARPGAGRGGGPPRPPGRGQRPGPGHRRPGPGPRRRRPGAGRGGLGRAVAGRRALVGHRHPPPPGPLPGPDRRGRRPPPRRGGGPVVAGGRLRLTIRSGS